MIETFETALRRKLEVLDIDLPHELWVLIAWLEEKGQHFKTPTGAPFLSVMPVASAAELWSHLAFELPDDLVRHWFGKDGLEKSVIPVLRCGGDGSHIALWRHSGAPDRFVFLGSEGEAFNLAEDVKSFITLITMGYQGIEDRFSLTETPEENWANSEDGEWPDAPELHNWASQTFGIRYPATGASLLPYPADDDPFAVWVVQITQE